MSTPRSCDVLSKSRHRSRNVRALDAQYPFPRTRGSHRMSTLVDGKRTSFVRAVSAKCPRLRQADGHETSAMTSHDCPPGFPVPIALCPAKGPTVSTVTSLGRTRFVRAPSAITTSWRPSKGRNPSSPRPGLRPQNHPISGQAGHSPACSHRTSAERPQSGPRRYATERSREGRFAPVRGGATPVGAPVSSISGNSTVSSFRKRTSPKGGRNGISPAKFRNSRIPGKALRALYPKLHTAGAELGPIGGEVGTLC
jgi:hypothetical protein